MAGERVAIAVNVGQTRAATKLVLNCIRRICARDAIVSLGTCEYIGIVKMWQFSFVLTTQERTFHPALK